MAEKELYELVLTGRHVTDGVVEIIRSLMQSIGFKEQDIITTLRNDRFFISIYCKNRVKAKDIEKKLKQLNLKKVKCSLKILKSKDWKKKWKENFKPFNLTAELTVIPAWKRGKIRINKREPIYIDTSGAFGSGLHETTKFSVDLIKYCRNRFESFLDVGTGTGILSIVAAKYGVKDITAIDADDYCVKVAKANMSANNGTFKKITNQSVKAFSKGRKYDYVAANLVTSTLIEHKKALAALVKPEKYLAVSGISLENLPVLKRAYKTLNVRCLKTIKGKDWTAVLYKKIK